MRKRTVALAIAAATLMGVGVSAGPAQAADQYGVPIKIADGLCLDIPNDNIVNGQAIQQYQCNGSPAQTWDIVDVGASHFIIRNTQSGYCLNNWTSTGATGNYIRLYYNCSSHDSLFNTVGGGDAAGYFEFQPINASSTCVNMWGGGDSGNLARLYPCVDPGGQDYMPNAYFDV